MIISIHQPNFAPYLGYFYKIYKSDVFVFLDDTQFSTGNFQNYNYIKSAQGKLRLALPVEYSFGDNINTVVIKDNGWEKVLLDKLRYNYKNAPYFSEVFNDISGIINSQKWIYLYELNMAIIKMTCNRMGFKTRFVLASDLSIESKKEEKVLDICETLGATEYLSGHGAEVYQSEDSFNQRGIQLTYTDFEDQPYNQLWGEYISNLSILDYLFNCGYRNPFLKKPKIVAFVPVQINDQNSQNKDLIRLGDSPLCFHVTKTLLNVPLIDNVYIYCSNSNVVDYCPKNIIYLSHNKSLDGQDVSDIDIETAFCNEIDADYYVLAYPTAPFLKSVSIENALRKIINCGYDSSFSAEEIKSYCWYQGQPLNYSLTSIVQKHDIEPIIRETNGFYVFSKNMLMKEKRRIGDNPYIQLVNNIESIAVETKDDWNLCEAIVIGGENTGLTQIKCRRRTNSEAEPSSSEKLT